MRFQFHPIYKFVRFYDGKISNDVWHFSLTSSSSSARTSIERHSTGSSIGYEWEKQKVELSWCSRGSPSAQGELSRYDVIILKQGWKVYSLWLLTHFRFSTKDKGLIVHVSASKLRILEIADEIGFLKPTKSQGLKSFNIGSLDDFLYEEGMTTDDILTPAERQFTIKYALNNIKAESDERFIPGSTSTHLYHGQSIMSASINDGLIVDFYSLHDKEFVKRLGDEWWNVRNVWKSQPIEKIRTYFGDVVGMYFGFVGTLKKAFSLRQKKGKLKYSLSFFSRFAFRLLHSSPHFSNLVQFHTISSRWS